MKAINIEQLLMNVYLDLSRVQEEVLILGTVAVIDNMDFPAFQQKIRSAKEMLEVWINNDSLKRGPED